MKKLAIVLFLFFFCIPNLYAIPPSWPVVADQAQKSIVFVEISKDNLTKGSCSGFVINQMKGYVLTAGHCDGEVILVDGGRSVRVFKDERKDLMVLRSSTTRPEMRLAKQNSLRGEEIASMGFGMGLETPLFRIGHVSSNKLEIDDLSGPFLMTDISQVHGMSGGPIFNQIGEVVSIVQRTSPEEGFGIGVTLDVLKDKVGRFFSE